MAWMNTPPAAAVRSAGAAPVALPGAPLTPAAQAAAFAASMADRG